MNTEELENKLNGLAEKVDMLINRITPSPIQINVSLREYLRAGQIFSNDSNAFVIVILDSCIRTRCGMVHKWTYLQHFGCIGVGKVNDDAERFIEDNNLKYVGEIKDFLTLNLPYKRQLA